MANLILGWSDSNSMPASTDPLHYRSFAATSLDDREIVEASVVDDAMLDWSKQKTVLGIYRKLKAHLKTADIVGNRDFFEAFCNSQYRWALVNAGGYYFNEGNYSSPSAVPVQFENADTQKFDVPNLIENGLQFVTKKIYQRSAKPTGSAEIGGTIYIHLTSTMALKCNVFGGPIGGPYIYLGYFVSGYFSDAIGHAAYKLTVVGMGGESEMSDEFQPT